MEDDYQRTLAAEIKQPTQNLPIEEIQDTKPLGSGETGHNLREDKEEKPGQVAPEKPIEASGNEERSDEDEKEGEYDAVGYDKCGSDDDEEDQKKDDDEVILMVALTLSF